MKDVEIELNLNSITDTMKSLADGIKEHRTTKLIDIDGKGISITIACNKEDHLFRDIDKTDFVEIGTFQMTLIGPRERQTSIDDFSEEEDEEDVEAEKPKAKRGRPKSKGELKDEINAIIDPEK